MTVKLNSPLTAPSINSGRRSLIVGGVAVAVAPAWLNVATAQNTPIKIGFPVPLTGAYSAEAQDQVRCAQIAIQEFNDSGGLNGRKAELLVRDDKLNPGEAATRTLELIEKDKVDFVVGSLSAATQLSINAVCRDRKILFNSISQSDAINEAKDWSLYTFHEALNPHLTAGAVARYAFPKFGKKVVYLTADYAYGHEMVRGFQRAGQTMGVQMLADIRHPIGAADYSAFLPRIQALKPDIFGVEQLWPRPVERRQTSHRLWFESHHQNHHAYLALHRTPSRWPGGVRRHHRRHVLLLGHGRQSARRQSL